MENKIYLLFNKLSLRYESSLSYPTDEFAASKVSAAGVSPDEYDLVCCATYDISTGIVKPLDPYHVAIKPINLINKE